MKPFLTLLALFLSGCATIPMAPEQWAREQRYRQSAAEAGVPYKGPHAIKAEAEQAREDAAGVVFAGEAKP